MNTAIDFYRQQFAELSGSLPGGNQSSLQAARQAAIQVLTKNGFPDRHHEDWRYTNLTALLGHPLRPFVPNRMIPSVEPVLLMEKASAQLVFVDGILDTGHSVLPEAGSGITIHVLNDEILDTEKMGDLVSLSHDHVPDRGDAFDALNAAFATSGCLIEVAAGCKLEHPVCITTLTTEQADSTSCHYRHLVRVGKGSEVDLVEYFPQGEGTVLNNVVTRIDLDQNSRCRHYRIQNENLQSHHISRINVKQARDSSYKSFSAALGSRLGKVDIHVDQNETGCETIFDGVFVGHKRQYLDHHTCVEHRHPQGRSDELYRGVLDDAARGVFNGRVVVHAGADKTDASQSNKNLLLSSRAEMDTKPELEIYADDVKCSHGATVGQIDEDRLFYLQSRGIDSETARILLIFAFLEDVLVRIELPELRRKIEPMIIARLPRSEILKDAALS
ncbi:MAG: Fe-S cluster assembly protein SufD [Gammaproteobacteria bacterium]|nr:MAG: Fe-S cluster assembly protein SufD [Gammaproteobacteria bacterium]